MNKELVRKIRNAAIMECVKHGITDPHAVRKTLNRASASVQPMSIAGVMAARTKGQDVYYIVK